MENTKPNRIKFAMMYYGQDVVKITKGVYGKPAGSYLKVDENYPPHVRLEGMYRKLKSVLELKYLGDLTEEDGIELLKMQFGKIIPLGFNIIEYNTKHQGVPCIKYSFTLFNGDTGFSEIAFLGGSKDFYNKLSVEQFKYAVSKGYYVGDGSEIRYGWVKLKED